MIMRVIAMTPDQINMLPPTERASIIQLVKIFLNCVGAACPDFSFFPSFFCFFLAESDVGAAGIRVYSCLCFIRHGCPARDPADIKGDAQRPFGNVSILLLLILGVPTQEA